MDEKKKQAPKTHFVYVDPRLNLFCPNCGYVEKDTNIENLGKVLIACPLCIKTDPNPFALVEWKYLAM